MKKLYHLFVTRYKRYALQTMLKQQEGDRKGRPYKFSILHSPFSILLFLLLPSAALAQCPDFTNLYNGDGADGVTAYTGRTAGYGTPFDNIGLVSGRHERIDSPSPGTDPRTGGNLSIYPPEGGPVIKLGNQNTGCEAEALVYEFVPEIENPILLLNFAVVFQDPDHPFIHQPRFILRVTDTYGNLLDDCTESDVTSVATIPGFQRYGNVNWRDWTKMSVDLSQFVGQLIQVQIINYDCNYCGHYGYCYFTAKCMPNILKFAIDCEATSFKLKAPDAFGSYLWSNGQTTDTATFTINDVMDKQITCQVVSDMGCECTLYAYITTDNDIIDSADDYSDVICEGEPYTKHSFNLPPQEAGTHHYQIAILDPVTCEQYVSYLELEVIERYNHIKEAICYKQPFNNYHLWSDKIPEYPLPGVYRDTVKTGELLTPPYCDLYDVLELVVSVDMKTISIEGDLSPCTGELVTYSFLGPGFETLTYSEWQLPANAVPKSSIYNTPQITLYFTDVTTPCYVTLSGYNGCGPGDATLSITPRQSYNIQYTEEICQGLVYSDDDFNLGVQSEFGYFVHSKHFQSVYGCDSAITLGLNVLPLPEVYIEPIDTATCNPGDEVTLWALIDAEVYPDNDCSNPDPDPYLFAFHYNCGYSYSWSPGGATTPGITVTPTTTTTYTVTVLSDIGCTATATQTVVVNVGNVVIDETICFGETYDAYNIHIPNATPDDNDSYSGSITTDGCTVDVTVNLTVLDSAVFIIKDTLCSGDTYMDDDGFYYEFDENGTYIDIGDGAYMYIDTIHFISKAGCDSLVIFNFTINPQKETFINDNICQFERYDRNGFDTVLNVAGRHDLVKTFNTYQECDSVVVVRLDVYRTPVDAVDFDFVVGYPGATTTLTNWSLIYDANVIAGWEWYLDDDPSPFATTKDASHIFTEAGHTVTLKVQGINGCWAEVTKEIPLLECPVPTLEVDKTVETCGLETVTIEGSFEDADKISIKTLNSPGRKARITVNNDGTFTITYSPTIANIGKVVEIVITATDSSISCPGTTETISITVKPKPRIKTKGECVDISD